MAYLASLDLQEAKALLEGLVARKRSARGWGIVAGRAPVLEVVYLCSSNRLSRVSQYVAVLTAPNAQLAAFFGTPLHRVSRRAHITGVLCYDSDAPPEERILDFICWTPSAPNDLLIDVLLRSLGFFSFTASYGECHKRENEVRKS